MRVRNPLGDVKILFDHGVPAKLRRRLPEHEIDTAAERGWDELDNGALMDHAEANGYDLFLTNDKVIPNEDDLRQRSIKVVALERNNWPLVRENIPEIRRAIAKAQSGGHVMARISFPARRWKKRHGPVRDVQISYHAA